MGISLTATGWFMYIDIPQTPNAVVICVIIYNAFFGYSWGPIPWLYPPEVRCHWRLLCLIAQVLNRSCLSLSAPRECLCLLLRTGPSTSLLVRVRPYYKMSLVGACIPCMASSVPAVSSSFISVSTWPLFLFLSYSDCVTVYPETRGVPLEEMDAVFGEGSCLSVDSSERGADLYCRRTRGT